MRLGLLFGFGSLIRFQLFVFIISYSMCVRLFLGAHWYLFV